MRWYQGSDPNVGIPGFLSFHRQIGYFLMLEDLKKIEVSWREMDKFAPFSKKLFTMTNLNQKQLKEEMATSFVRKMSSQVRKHNKQYLLTKHLIRSVFAERETGQAVAQLLKGSQEAMASLSGPYFSRQHDREIDCEKFAKFLRDKIPLTLLAELRTDPTIQFHSGAIDQIAVGPDMWDEGITTNKNAFAAKRCARSPPTPLLSTTMNGW
jgi:hypothetical protein